MSTAAAPYPAQLGFEGGLHIARWRPLVQWLLGIPQLLIAGALEVLRGLLTLISFFSVLFTEQIPRPVFDMIAMTYRYEWQAASYALFLREDYPPFDFQPVAGDDGVDPHTVVTLTYPDQLGRWKPLYKWFLAIPLFVVLFGLSVAAVFAVIASFFAVAASGEYPVELRNFLVGVYRYNLRLQAYVGLLNDQYPPFALSS
jgi:hypothetical protein